jgi:hypothetical protein
LLTFRTKDERNVLIRYDGKPSADKQDLYSEEVSLPVLLKSYLIHFYKILEVTYYA